MAVALELAPLAGGLAWAERIAEERARSSVAAERIRIARELHDVVAYSFATINVQAGVAAHVVDERPEHAVEALRAIKAASKEALRELRAILGMLRHVEEEGPHGSAPGLDRLDDIVQTTTDAGVPTSMLVSGRARTVPEAVDRTAYRIVQEALTNVLRHAGPASACVSIVYEADRLLIVVEDDGGGQADDGGEEAEASGYGLVGMRERATAVGGDVQAGPGAEGGFHVRASLPLPPDV